LPPGSQRTLDDPYEDKEAARQKARLKFLIVLIVLAAAAIWIRWNCLQRGHYFWQPAPPALVVPIAVPVPATPPAPEAKK